MYKVRALLDWKFSVMFFFAFISYINRVTSLLFSFYYHWPLRQKVSFWRSLCNFIFKVKIILYLFPRDISKGLNAWFDLLRNVTRQRIVGKFQICNTIYVLVFLFQIVYIKSEVVGKIRILKFIIYENLFVFCNGNWADEQNTCSQLS